jgi:putative salt-induced outer membrane protein YdiY
MRIALAATLLLAVPALAQDAKPDAKPEDKPIDPQLKALGPADFFHGWTGGVEVGLAGSEGNSEVLNLHAGVNAERKTDLMDTKGSLTYLLARENNANTKNRFEADLRNDWLFAKDSPWRYYLMGTFEYDQFQDWHERVTATNGIGYAFIQNDTTLLLGRVGVGLEKEFGGSDNRIHPEGDLGVDFEHKISDRQKIALSADYYPDFLDLTNYRATGKAAWEVLVDPQTKLSLKVGCEDRYDPTPNGKKRNDFDYFALLVWAF